MPEGDGPFPGVVVVMEVFGLNDHIGSVISHFGRRGFLAIAPDLYVDHAPGTVIPYGELTRAREIRATLSDTRALEHIGRAVRWLREHDTLPGAGIVGYCMGGRLSLLAGAKVEGIAAAVGYYPSGLGLVDPPQGRGNIHALPLLQDYRVPALVHFGADDDYIPPDHIGRIAQGLAASKVQTELVIHAGAGHAFNNDDRPEAFRQEAARQAWERTLAFFWSHLG